MRLPTICKWCTERKPLPPRPKAGEDELRQESELLRQGEWGHAMNLTGQFVFPTTTERFTAWSKVAGEGLRTIDHPHQTAFMERVVDLLASMAPELNDNATWSATAEALARFSFTPGSAPHHVVRAIRAAAAITCRDERGRCIRKMVEVGLLSRHAVAIPQIYRDATPAEQSVMRVALLVSVAFDHCIVSEVVETIREQMAYTAEDHAEANTE